MDQSDPLRRFIEAQETTYQAALSELQAGRKRTHWMWFIFPQIQGLGQSSTSRFYAIAGRAEAEAYLRHPVLGQRLAECTQAVLNVRGRSVHDIFGSPDDLKFHSSMTLFAAVSPPESVFHQALETCFGDATDPATMERI